VAPHAIVLTPNLAGRDGISRLSRLIAGTLQPSTVVALHDPAESTICDGVPVWGAGGRSSRFAAAALRATVGADADTIAVAVHLHVAPAALPFLTKGATLVTMLCGIEAWKPLTRLQRAALDRSARLIAISSATLERFRAANPHFARRAIDVCHPAIEDTASRAPIQGPPTVLIVGRMSIDERYKGHDQLIDLWPAVAEAVPGAVLRIAGGGDDRGRLEQKAAALGVRNQIVFTGALSDDDLAEEWARSTVFAMPSRDEGFGFVFVEAMRAGRPCIACRGAASEILVSEETGLFVEPGDARQLRDALVRLLADRSLAAEMGARGRARFLDQFTVDRFRDRFAALVPAADASLSL